MTEALWAGEFGDEYMLRNADAGEKRGPFWRDLVARIKPASVLEIGCNAGANLRWLKSVPRLAGIDVNPYALSSLKKIRMLVHPPPRPSVGDLDGEAFVEVGYLHEPLPDGSWHPELSIASATEIPYADASFDLVFTSGVLIHLDDEQLPRAMDEMVRVSRRFVLAIEYEADEVVEVPYRGRAGALWKRPYELLYEQRFPALVRMAEGHLGPDEGWDDCNWWLWEKR